MVKQRKAAKAWHLRFDLIKKLSAVERFVFGNKSGTIATGSPSKTVSIEEGDPNFATNEAATSAMVNDEMRD